MVSFKARRDSKDAFLALSAMRQEPRSQIPVAMVAKARRGGAIRGKRGEGWKETGRWLI